jgi:hypothetical protein
MLTFNHALGAAVAQLCLPTVMHKNGVRRLLETSGNYITAYFVHADNTEVCMLSMQYQCIQR